MLAEFDGRELEYQDIPGRPDQRPLVLLHEGLGSVGLWRGLPQMLAERTQRRTIAFSRLGHGASDPPARPRALSFMEEEAECVLPALLHQWQIAEPVLIGHSDGASIALLHAARHSVAGLVLIAPHVFVEEITVAAIQRASRDFTTGSLRQRLARHHRDPAVVFRNWCDVWLDPEFREWNIVNRVPSVASPILLVQGQEDPYGSLAQIEAIEDAARVPTIRQVVSGGHSPHIEQQDVVVPAITRFLEELDLLAC